MVGMDIVNSKQKDHFDSMMNNIKPSSPVKIFFKVVGLIALVLVVVMGALVAYFAYDDHQSDLKKIQVEAQNQSRLKTATEGKEPQIKATRHVYDHIETLYAWYINDTDRHVIIWQSGKYYELSVNKDLDYIPYSYGYSLIMTRNGINPDKISEKQKIGNTIICYIDEIEFNEKKYDSVNETLEPWNFSGNTCLSSNEVKKSKQLPNLDDQLVPMGK